MLVCWCARELVGSLACWLVGLLARWLVGSLVCWFVCSLVQLVGRSFGRFLTFARQLCVIPSLVRSLVVVLYLLLSDGSSILHANDDVFFCKISACLY